MRSKEAFAYSRSTGYFCSLAAPAAVQKIIGYSKSNRSQQPRRKAGMLARAVDTEVSPEVAAEAGRPPPPRHIRACPRHGCASPRYAFRGGVLIFRNWECRYLSIFDSLDAGHPLEVAESMLHALEAARRIFETHRQLVLDQRTDPSAEQPAARAIATRLVGCESEALAHHTSTLASGAAAAAFMMRSTTTPSTST